MWGIETWTDICVRPINNAFAGTSMFGASSCFDYIYAYSPDLIIHEANLLNDTRVDLNATEALYEAVVYSNIKEKEIPILVIITHAPGHALSVISVNPDDCPDMEDATKEPRYYPQYAAMIKRVCGRLDIPYINVFQYQYDLYKGIIPTDLFVDNIHLSAKGHEMYKKLMNYVFENNY